MDATKAVLVTGASSGIGRCIVGRLAAAGLTVYAGARKPEDLRDLASIQNVNALRLDVTVQDDVMEAVDGIHRAGKGLYGLVNNAGIAAFGDVAVTDDLELELVMSVNAHGVYRLTRACLPLILESQGRIINIGSLSGVLAGRSLSVYSMSKHALEAFTDSLGDELKRTGACVSIIEPGAVKTELVRNLSRRRKDSKELPDLSGADEPAYVSAIVEAILFADKPRRRYLAPRSYDEARRVIAKQVELLVQLNDGHAFGYDREALVGLLDRALKSEGGQ